MINPRLESVADLSAGSRTRWAHYAVLGAVCALVIGVYAWSAKSGREELGSLKAENNYYNLLVQGFRAGQLNLKREVPSAIVQLPDSYDPVANSPYWLMEHQLLDLSYYKGKLYLYFGVTPALVLFWPFATLTGHYLLYEDAVVLFFSVGFLASVCLLWMAWRRYFAEVSVGVVAAGALAVGLTNFTLAILQRCEVYEVAISCGYAFATLSLLAIWNALHASRGRAWWLAGASMAYGLAVGARPSLLFGAVILLVPVAMAWWERVEPGHRSQVWPLLLGASVPILLIGLGLMLYNYLRFDNLFEFGWCYQLGSAGQRSIQPQYSIQPFSLRYLWFNLRVYFLELAGWSGRFPFVCDIISPPLPVGHFEIEDVFGILTNTPLVWLALTIPLAWRDPSSEPRHVLRWFGLTLVLMFGMCALTLGFFFAAYLRYEVEFLPALVLLAVLGILGLERTLARRWVWRRATRGGWGLLLAFSVSFNLLAMVTQSSKSYVYRGAALSRKGQVGEAIAQLQKALELQPDNPKAHNNIGNALLQQGKVTEAITHLEEALRLTPNLVEAHINLGTAWLQQGKVAEGIAQIEEALRLEPDNSEAHNNLGYTLLQLGRAGEASGHLESALRLKPDFVDAQNNLATALFRQGKVAEAIGHLKEVLRLKPEYAEARNQLAWLLATGADASVRNGARAVELAEEANQLAGGKSADILDTLAAAYAEAGRFDDAVRTARTALELAKQSGPAEPAQRIEERLRLYQAGRPYHEGTAREP